MSLCINPNCSTQNNSDNQLYCEACGSELLLEGLYRVQRQLGGGGFGKVYELSRGNTLKILKILTLSQPIALKLFQQEAEVLGKLNHPGIPRVEPDGYFIYFPKDSKEPLHCLVMEKIEGEDLETYLNKKGKPISQKLALKWLIEIAEILEKVHQQGFLHRDIKPANIMLRPNGQLVLIDFGTVKEITATVMASEAKKQGTGVYTPGYAPPEQEKGFTVLKSDFYALGRTFVHLLTNKPPLAFYNPNTDELDWRGAVPNLSPLLADLLDELMQRLAKDRPKDTGVILQRLGEIEQQLYPPPGLIQPIQTPPSTVYSPSPTINVSANKVDVVQVASFRLKVRSYSLLIKLTQIGLILFGLSLIVYCVKLIFDSVIKFELKFLGFLVGLLYIIGKLHDFLDKVQLLPPTAKCIAISPNGKTLAVGSNDRSIKILDLVTGKELRILTGYSYGVECVVISRDGTTLIGSDGIGTTSYDLATGKELCTLKGGGGINSIAISPDSNIFVSQGYGNNGNSTNIKIRDLPAGNELRTITGYSIPFDPVFAIHPDGKSLLGCCDDKTIKIWDLVTGQVLRTLTHDFDGINSIAISPDGKTLVSGGYWVEKSPKTSKNNGNKTIKIWDLATGKELQTLTTNGRGANSVAISRNGQTLAVSEEDFKTIKIWNLLTGEKLQTIMTSGYGVQSIAITPDGKTLISGSCDNTIKIWRLER
jgi:serine/threonine protein kinase